MARHVLGRALVAAAMTMPLLAMPAQAGTEVFGSDLSRAADVVDSDQQDVVFWPSPLTAGGFRVPADGQIRSVRIRGFANSESTWRFEDGLDFRGGERLFHVQVLQPVDGGRFRIRDKGTSNHLYLPGPAQGATRDTVTEFQLENLCAHAGDYVAFNGVGGWDRTANGRFAGGTPLHIFARSATSATNRFRGADQSNNGATISGSPQPARELLMQMTLGTGPDAFYECPGGTFNPFKPGGALGPPAPGPAPSAPPRTQLVTLPSRQRVTLSKAGRGVLAVFCQPGSSRCSGKVEIFSGRTRIAKAPFANLGPKSGARVRFKLTRRGLALFKRRRGRLPVKIVATMAPGGPGQVHTLRTTLRKRVAR